MLGVCWVLFVAVLLGWWWVLGASPLTNDTRTHTFMLSMAGGGLAGWPGCQGVSVAAHTRLGLVVRVVCYVRVVFRGVL